MEEGVVRETGATEGIRGDKGANDGCGLAIECAVDCRRLRDAPEPSRGDSIGDKGGVTMTFGSRMLWFERRFLSGWPMFSVTIDVTDGPVSAVIGAARANGEEIEDGVEARVPTP